MEPVFEKGYPSYEAVNRGTVMSDQTYLDDKDMVIRLHDIARIMEAADATAGFELRKIADRFSQLIEKAATRRHWCDGNE